MERFRQLLNCEGALAEARPRLRSVEIPWRSAEEVQAEYDAYLAAMMPEEDAEEPAEDVVPEETPDGA